MAASKRLGAVKNAAPEQSPWTTLHQLKELDGEIGRQATTLGRGAARHRISAAGIAGVVESTPRRCGHGMIREWVREWMRAQ